MDVKLSSGMTILILQYFVLKFGFHPKIIYCSYLNLVVYIRYELAIKYYCNSKRKIYNV